MARQLDQTSIPRCDLTAARTRRVSCAQLRGVVSLAARHILGASPKCEKVPAKIGGKVKSASKQTLLGALA
jgi:hypothetical protein